MSKGITVQPGQVIETISSEESARWQKQLQAISDGWVKSTPNGAAIHELAFSADGDRLAAGPPWRGSCRHRRRQHP